MTTFDTSNSGLSNRSDRLFWRGLYTRGLHAQTSVFDNLFHATEHAGSDHQTFLVAFQDAPAPPPEGATFDARDRNVAPLTYRQTAQRIARLLQVAENRPYDRAGVLIAVELNRLSSLPRTAATNRRQFLACLNYELRQHGLWVTRHPTTGALTFRRANAGADTFRRDEEPLHSVTLSAADIRSARFHSTAGAPLG